MCVVYVRVCVCVLHDFLAPGDVPSMCKTSKQCHCLLQNRTLPGYPMHFAWKRSTHWF